MNIILIGYRGSGKTTLGKLLAQQLWKTYADVDAEVVKRFGGQSIRAIWAEHGEPEFRRVEVEVTRELCGREEMVIGLGGGTLMQPGAREAVERARDAVRVYLRCRPEELARRIDADPSSAATRPALTAQRGTLEEIRVVLAEREPVYTAVADKVFDVTELSPGDAVRHLIKRCL